jgi:hypothetical protein
LQGRSIAGRLLPGAAKELPTLPESWQQKFVAHFFNAAVEQGREVEFVYKSFDIPPGIGMRDIENGSLIGLQYDSWMADINMAYNYEPKAAWFYNPNNPMKDADHLVDLLVDLTSTKCDESRLAFSLKSDAIILPGLDRCHRSHGGTAHGHGWRRIRTMVGRGEDPPDKAIA